MRQFILYSFLFIFQDLPAQTSGKFKIRTYTTENGLPSNGIKGLQWDEKTGFLWLATEAGIVRFNGIEFKTFSKENTPFINAERMQFLVRDNAGIIHAADQLSATFTISKNKLLFSGTFKPNDDSYGNSLYALSVSDRFFKYKQKQPGIKKYTLNYDKIIPISDTSMLAISQANVWLQTMQNKMPIPLPVTAHSIRSGFKIKDRIFFVTGKNEILNYDIAKQKLTEVYFATSQTGGLPVLTGNSNIFWENGMNSPILIDKHYAWKLEFDDNKITALELCNILPSDVLIHYVQYSDDNKLLFIGTNSKGIMVVSQNSVAVVKSPQLTVNERNAYYSQIELPDGSILTNEGQVIGAHKTGNNPLPISGKFSFNTSTTGDTLLWYSQFNPELKSSCLSSYNYRSRQRKIYTGIKASSIIVLALADKTTAIVSEAGIGKMINDSLHVATRFPGLKNNNLPGDALELKPGILLVAMQSGVLRYDFAHNKTDTVIQELGFNARTLFRYKGHVFIGTYGRGFYMYKDGRLVSMPVDKNKYLLYTHCFVPDDQGYCWISTNRGLFISRLDELVNYFDNKTSKIYYHYYGRNDGMEITEMNGGCLPCAITLKNGTISFPTMDGLLWVNPRVAHPVLPRYEIFIDGLVVDNKLVDMDVPAGVHLDHKSEEIIVELGVSSWGNDENIYLEYQLNDTLNWKKVNTAVNKSIFLNKLQPGRYALRIRKKNGFGENNYSYKAIEFTIEPPWYNQWWFYLLLVSGALGLLYVILKIRTGQLVKKQERLEKQIAEKTIALQQQNEILEKNNTINTRLISIISHDIITPLKFLHVAGKNLLEKKSLMSEDLKDETIKEITTTSKELQLLSTNILNWIKYQNENRRLVKEEVNVHEMLNQIFGVLNSMAHQKGLTLKNNVNPGLRITQLFEPLKILIYNLVTNAIHFSDKGDICIDAVETDTKVVISVKDEGAGMTKEQIKNIMADQFIISSANIDNKKGNGLGYLIIKDLLKMMNASLNINSEKGKGTTVNVELPK